MWQILHKHLGIHVSCNCDNQGELRRLTNHVPRTTYVRISSCITRDTTARLRVTSTRTSCRRKDAIFINLSPIFIAQFRFFVLFLLYHLSCKLKIGNRIVKDPDEVAEDCMTL